LGPSIRTDLGASLASSTFGVALSFPNKQRATPVQTSNNGSREARLKWDFLLVPFWREREITEKKQLARAARLLLARPQNKKMENLILGMRFFPSPVRPGVKLTWRGR
jgi:hypothetical protein